MGNLFDTMQRYLAHPDSPHRVLTAMFPAEQHDKALSVNRFRRFVKDRSRMAGCDPPITPRMLRHAFATEMYRMNTPLWAIQAMMGHDRVADTAVYVHVSHQMIQAALNCVSIQAGRQ